MSLIHKNIIIKLAKQLIIITVDVIFTPITIFYVFYLRTLRRRNFADAPISRKIFFKVGVLPIIDHYYEPLFKHKNHLRN